MVGAPYLKKNGLNGAFCALIKWCGDSQGKFG